MGGISEKDRSRWSRNAARLTDRPSTVIEKVIFDVRFGLREEAPKHKRPFKTTYLLSEGEIRGLQEMLGTLNTSLLSLQETGKEPNLFAV